MAANFADADVRKRKLVKALDAHYVRSTLESARMERYPFPFLVVDGLFSDDHAAQLRDWLAFEARWWLQLRDFYTHETCENIDACPLVAADGPLSKAARAEIAEVLSARFGTALDHENASLGAHRMSPGNGIGIHTDNPVLGTESLRLVVTLTDQHYDDRQGGHLCLFNGPDEGNLTTVIRPAHNSAVAFGLSERSYHAVSTVSAGCRYSLVFGFWPEGSSPERATVVERIRPHRAPEDVAGRLDGGQRIVEFLCASGADQLEHSGARLLDHLLGVAHILLDWEAERDVVVAGLFHSVFGTSTFRHALIPEAGRSRLREVIGERAERLAWLFCTVAFSEVYRFAGGSAFVARSRLDGASLTLSEAEVRDLDLIAAANLVEQDPGGRLSPGEAFEWRTVLGRFAQQFPPKAVAALERLIG